MKETHGTRWHIMFQANGEEVIKGSGVYKMVDPRMPAHSCSNQDNFDAMEGHGIEKDLAVMEATRQRLRSMQNKAARHSHELTDPL